MVIAAHRAYSDACAWIRSSARGSGSLSRAKSSFGWAYLWAFVTLGTIGILSPRRFGTPGATAFRGGWATALLIVSVTACLVYLMTKTRYLAWAVARALEPFRRDLSEDPAFEGAAGALSSCPAALRSRFAFGWVWGPLGLATLGVVFAAASAYFLVDAILARFQVGWGQPVFALGHALVSLFLFVVAARRLRTWRLAASVRRAVRN